MRSGTAFPSTETFDPGGDIHSYGESSYRPVSASNPHSDNRDTHDRTKPMTRLIARFDSDASKGASETELPQSHSPNHPTRPDIHGNLSAQLPHRDPSELAYSSDSDFPEPGSNPEHSGQRFIESRPKPCQEVNFVNHIQH
jgi:hypothetical protein